ncbi:MAG: acyl carrier protein [Pseudomonadales bacterium]|nr:acyl carrier protein [Pseudomonadales bacterium]
MDVYVEVSRIIFETVGKKVTLTSGTELTTLGLDSLDWAEVLLAIEEHYKIELPVEELAEATTMEHILRSIEDERSG